jgi:hypothetical protein
MTIYQVKPGRIIYVDKVEYREGARLKLTPSQALLHATSIFVAEIHDEEAVEVLKACHNQPWPDIPDEDPTLME